MSFSIFTEFDVLSSSRNPPFYPHLQTKSALFHEHSVLSNAYSQVLRYPTFLGSSQSYVSPIQVGKQPISNIIFETPYFFQPGLIRLVFLLVGHTFSILFSIENSLCYFHGGPYRTIAIPGPR